MDNTDKLTFNFFAGMHNLSLVAEAEKLINSFIGKGDGIVYAVNPDGTYLKLQKGVYFTAIDGLGIEKE